MSVVDLLSLLEAWGECPPPPERCTADLDDDGNVNVIDFLILIGNWG